jgi:HdeA/HdeB family
MTGKIAVLLLSGMLFACVQAQPPVDSAPPAPPPPPAPVAKAAPAGHIVIIRKASCGDLLGLSADDRQDASMFYIGYQSARVRARTVNVGAVPTMLSLAIDYCVAHPDRTAVEAFAVAYSRSRR